MKRAKKLLAVLLILALAVTIAGCGKKTEPTPAPGPTPAQPPKEVVIGYSGPLSGPAAEYGQDCLNGIIYAVEEIKNAGGFEVNGQKYIFKLESIDDGANPTQSVTNARRLQELNAVAITNPVMTSIAPMIELNQEAGNEFLMLAYTSTPKVVQTGNKYLVAVPPPFTVYINAFSKLAWDKGWRKGAMVITLGAYGDEWRQLFKAHWEGLGGQITADQPANYYTEVDYSAQLTASLATNPDFLLIGGPSQPTALVMEQARMLGFTGAFLLIDQAKMEYIESLIGLDMMGEVIGVGRIMDFPSATAKKFDDGYTKRFGVMNTWESVLNYTMTHKLALAMQAAGSVDDVAAIVAAYPKVYPIKGDTYPVEYFGVEAGGATYLPAMVQTIEAGKYSKPALYVWWAKTDAEFQQVKSQAQDGSNMVKMDLKR
ncbi:MAG: ABC transporter substrate-binding protein [Dethiobacter sp.]|jgi:branched-chain amino acid transport system substrate-binding protein|nr:ABC transporter substrate-binding protein [Dethiobacter sp.]